MSLSITHTVHEDDLAYALCGLDSDAIQRFGRNLAEAINSQDEGALEQFVTALTVVLEEWKATA